MINNINGNTAVNQSYELKEKQNSKVSEIAPVKESQAAVLELGKSSESSPTYSKPKAKNIDAAEINRLWKESQDTYKSLRELVESLISKQGKKLDDLLNGKEVLLIDEETKAAAAMAISENGEFGVKAVSERIVDFAKALSGDDKAKFDELKDAIIQGFKEAEKAFGGKLPDISQNTYDEVMKQLDEWKQS
jgi:phosphoenolpyruvate-protein kinase (PTS system EI component)